MKKEKNPAIEWFCKQVGKGLKCDHKTRSKLLNRLKRELYDEGFPQNVSTREIIQAIGEPEEVSNILLDTVPVSSLLKNSRKKLVSTMLIATALLAILLGIGLVLLSRDRGNLVFDKTIPKKEKVYKEDQATYILFSDIRQYRNKLYGAWGKPILSRTDYDCWTYKDTYIISDYGRVNHENGGFIQFYKTVIFSEMEITDYIDGHYRARSKENEFPFVCDFEMENILLRQETELNKGDVIMLEIDPRYQDNTSDEDGQIIRNFSRILGVYKTFSEAENKEEANKADEHSAMSDEMMSAGIVTLLLGFCVLSVYAFYRVLLRKTGQKESSEEERCNDIPESEELDKDGLIGYISLMTNIDKR